MMDGNACAVELSRGCDGKMSRFKGGLEEY